MKNKMILNKTILIKIWKSDKYKKLSNRNITFITIKVQRNKNNLQSIYDCIIKNSQNYTIWSGTYKVKQFSSN